MAKLSSPKRELCPAQTPKKRPIWPAFNHFPLDPLLRSVTLGVLFRWVARPAVSFLSAEEVPCGYFGTQASEAL